MGAPYDSGLLQPGRTAFQAGCVLGLVGRCPKKRCSPLSPNPSRLPQKVTLHLKVQVMKARGWKETEGDDWDFFYADVGWIHENMTYHV